MVRWFAILCLFVATATAEVPRPWIGIALAPGTTGVIVKQVIDGTPGQRAGIHDGDEVLLIDKDAVKTPKELIQRVTEKGVGTKVSVTVLRDGKQLTFTLTLETKPEALALLKRKLMDKTAPAFELPDAVGPHAAKLADLTGHVVVVEFWATWCGFCKQVRPAVAGWHKAYKDLRVVAIAPDAFDDLKKVATDEKIPYTVAHDTDDKTARDYFVPGLPTFVVIDKAGVVRYVGVGAGDGFDGVEPAVKKLLGS